MIDRAYVAGIADAFPVASAAHARPLAADTRNQVPGEAGPKKLKDIGFTLTMGVVGEATAFVASYRAGAAAMAQQQ
ncbi:hypothetical protein LQ954_12450 [Sphingomonas sp. IC-11]|uniref:hypothetical protein n=1 Tax=Sphingomonas sp. IC-11 TaxID=2898528 RepID=UPI001E62147B|nr:hypothetical protein [Sphingomonas sp. IC-11]MCD2316960.1 hypothetical protein [Sphingomonas sp. IC-11]